MAADRNVVVVGDRSIKVTHPDKVMYPADNVTKVAVIAYYVHMAERMLPHMVQRPVTRIRWPQGVSGSRFFEKQLPAGAPDWVDSLTLEHSDGPVTYPLVPDAATLAWLAQLNALELHVPQWRWRDEAPHVDRLVLDLDPGPGTGLVQCIEVAQWLREQLTGDGLVSVPVTSGSKGLHLYAAWDASTREGSTSDYAKSLATAASAAFPKLVTAVMKREQRTGKVFIDWSQNNPNKTTITPYSLRGREHPFVATPRTWDELDEPGVAHLTMAEVLGRLDDDDPMAVLLSS
ncbi:MAG: non-homologous end-joining DNA ligase [Actinomycetes bacterium]